MPEVENELNRSKAPLRSALLFRESRISIDRSGPNSGSNNISKEKDNAFGSEKEGA